MLGRTLAQYCQTDSALKKEQQRIEDELKAFEKNIYGDQAKKDSLDSISKAKILDAKALKKKKSSTVKRGSKTSVEKKTKTSGNSKPSSGTARVSVRRERR